MSNHTRHSAICILFKSSSLVLIPYYHRSKALQERSFLILPIHIVCPTASIGIGCLAFLYFYARSFLKTHSPLGQISCKGDIQSLRMCSETGTHTQVAPEYKDWEGFIEFLVAFLILHQQRHLCLM